MTARAWRGRIAGIGALVLSVVALGACGSGQAAPKGPPAQPLVLRAGDLPGWLPLATTPRTGGCWSDVLATHGLVDKATSRSFARRRETVFSSAFVMATRADAQAVLTQLLGPAVRCEIGFQQKWIRAHLGSPLASYARLDAPRFADASGAYRLRLGFTHGFRRGARSGSVSRDVYLARRGRVVAAVVFSSARKLDPAAERRIARRLARRLPAT